MAEGIVAAIEQLSEAKGIDTETVLEAVKDAMLAAARKYYKTDEELIAKVNTTTKNIDVFAVKTVTHLVANPTLEVSLAQARRIDSKYQIGSEIHFPKPTRPMGRIAAQMAKQVIFQKIREAERETICAEFADRINTVEYCTVKRTEGQDLIVELGRTEARMPRREQSRLEQYYPGDRVRVVIKSIEKSGRGPAIIASRASEELVKRLFEQEVPEIYDDTVEIMGCAREAGERTKIAVKSRDRDVDAVGACVGMKGMRVQTIIRELKGEKIDIIQYIEDPLEMVRWALSPARVSRVEVLDPDERHMEVIVDETQLSLAIGKKGQNVRLAARLLGWRIDIKSEDEKRKEVEDARAAIAGGTPVRALLDYGLSAGLIQRLVRSGAPTVEELAQQTPENLLEIQGVGPELLERIRLAVNRYFAHLARTVGAVPAGDEPLPLDSEAPEDEEMETGESEAAPTVLPGVPDAVTTPDEDDDVVEYDVEELERFGKMNRYRGPTGEDDLAAPGLRGSGSAAKSAAVGATEE